MKDKLLLLHGALGTKDQFEELKHILEQNFEVYVMNFQGHGGAPIQNEFSIELFAYNVLIYLQEKSISKIHVFGYSMGGYVAMKLALDHSELIAKIVTLGTKFNWTKQGAEKEKQLLNPEKIEAKIPKFANQLSRIHGRDNWKEVVRNTSSLIHGLGNGKKIAHNMLKQIPHDVLIAVGKLDEMVTYEESKVVSELLPNGSLCVVDEFQHPIDSVDKRVLAVLINDFIKKQ